MKSKYGRTIHAFRSSGVNAPGYSRAPQPSQALSQPPAVPQSPAATQQPSTARTAPQRPTDATTPEEAMAGLWKATQDSVRLIMPRFRSTAGPWLRLGEHDIRIPPDVIVRTSSDVAVIAYLDNTTEAGRVQVLVARPQGIREMIGLSRYQLQQLREVFLGR